MTRIGNPEKIIEIEEEPAPSLPDGEPGRVPSPVREPVEPEHVPA